MTSFANPAADQLSVVIPSFNRRDALLELLDALARQSLDLQRFEIVVVLDGSTDGSHDAVKTWSAKNSNTTFRVFDKQNAGQSAARTYGARHASGPILLFLDDDMLPGVDCLAEHHRLHFTSPEPVVVLGDAAIAEADDESYYDLVTRMWWDRMYDQRRLRQPASDFRDLCSNHFSLPKALFFQVGGFDPDFVGYGGEDFELGYRLLQSGVPWVLAPQAHAVHRHRGSVKQVLRNLRSEGANDVLLGRKHPALAAHLRCHQAGPAIALILRFPGLFAAGLKCSTPVLGLLEKLGLWSAWRWCFGKSRFISYWLGIAKTSYLTTGRGSGRSETRC